MIAEIISKPRDLDDATKTFVGNAPRKIAVLQCPNDAQLAENLILATPARGHLRLVELPKIANIIN